MFTPLDDLLEGYNNADPSANNGLERGLSLSFRR
jgi:hypothetical protein